MLLRKPVVLPVLAVVCMWVFAYVYVCVWWGRRPLCWGREVTGWWYVPTCVGVPLVRGSLPYVH